jgi:WD40 repeat protein
MALSHVGQLLAASIYDTKANTTRVQLWEVTSGRILQTLRGHTARVGCVAFSPDGRFLAIGSQDRSVIVWDIATGEEMWTFRGHQDRVALVAFSPDGRRLASASGDGTIKVWDTSPPEGQ